MGCYYEVKYCSEDTVKPTQSSHKPGPEVDSKVLDILKKYVEDETKDHK